MPVCADVSQAREVARLVAMVTEGMGPIDILVNNAGVGLVRTVDDLTEADFDLTIAVNLSFLVATFPVAFKLGSQFMPPLYEGSSLYMPTALPGISITQASQVLQEQDRILKTFPEVETVFGVVGRSDSATDNAPLDMYDTTVMLKPREKWRAGMTYEKLIQEMDAKLQFPGLSNTWTMPVENRLDMELTGIKTPLGMKIQGPTLEGIQQSGAQIQQLRTMMQSEHIVRTDRHHGSQRDVRMQNLRRRAIFQIEDPHFAERRHPVQNRPPPRALILEHRMAVTQIGRVRVRR